MTIGRARQAPRHAIQPLSVYPDNLEPGRLDAVTVMQCTRVLRRRRDARDLQPPGRPAQPHLCHKGAAGGQHVRHDGERRQDQLALHILVHVVQPRHCSSSPGPEGEPMRSETFQLAVQARKRVPQRSR